jgi:hypothetical protein
MMLAGVHSVRSRRCRHEAAQHAFTLAGVGDFGVELHAVPATGLVGHRDDRHVAVLGYHVVKPLGISVTGRRGSSRRPEHGRCGDGVFDVPSSSASCRVAQHFDLGITEFAVVDCTLPPSCSAMVCMP